MSHQINLQNNQGQQYVAWVHQQLKEKSVTINIIFIVDMCTLSKYGHVWTAVDMVPTGSDESKLRTFQGPSQDQISGYKDFYGEFHNANT